MALDSLHAREDMAQHYASICTYASLHTADPAGNGGSEVSGGSPAYGRKPITWNAGVADGVVTSNPITMDVPANTDIFFVGLWDAQTGGNYQDKRSFQVTFVAQGTVTFNLQYTQD